MGLENKQNLLAHLYTRQEVRERFYADPVAVGSEFGLSPAEAQEIAEILETEAEKFAASLLHKRWNEVRKLLSPSLLAPGIPPIQPLFYEFARNYTPEGVGRHHEDAIAFLSTLIGVYRERDAAQRSTATNEYVPFCHSISLARYEQARLTVMKPNIRFLVRLFFQPVMDWTPEMMRKFTEWDTRPRWWHPTIVIWFRWRRGGRLHRWKWRFL